MEEQRNSNQAPEKIEQVPLIVDVHAKGINTSLKYLKPIFLIIFVVCVLIPMVFAAVQARHAIAYSIRSFFNDVSDSLIHFRYEEAGAGEAAHLPKIEEQKLYDNNGITITAESFGSLEGEQALAITVVNKYNNNKINKSSANLEVEFSDMAVNGCMMKINKTFSVGEGKTERCYLTLDSEALSDSLIDTVAEITFRMKIEATSGYSLLTRDYEVVDVQTDAYGLEQPVDDSGKVLIETRGIRMRYRFAQLNEEGNVELGFLIENLTDDIMEIRCIEPYIDGKRSTDPNAVEQAMFPNTRFNGKLSIGSEMGITSVEDLNGKEIEFLLYIEDAEFGKTETVRFTFPVSN